MYRCETWTIKNAEHWRSDAFKLWCWRKLDSPLDCKEIKPISPKGNQTWLLIRRTDTEIPTLWPSHMKSWVIGKDHDAGKDGRPKEKRAAEDDMLSLDSILKSRDITLPTNVCLVKAMVFPVVMYRCETWTIKKAEHWRINAFKLWWWRKLLSPLDSKEIKPVNPKGNKSWQLIGKTCWNFNPLPTWCKKPTH